MEIVPKVSTHSIRYRILKGLQELQGRIGDRGFNPFDPIQDTESGVLSHLYVFHDEFQPIRSDTGY